MFVGSMDCHTLQRVLASHSQLFFQSLTLKQLKQCAYRVYRLPSGEFRFFVRDTHGNKHGLQSNHINAYGTDFSLSKNSSHKTVLSCLCRCGESPTFSVLTLRRAQPTRGKNTPQGLPCLVCHPRPLGLYAHATRYPRPMLQNWGNLLPSYPVPSVGGGYTRRQRTPSIAPVSSFQGSKTVRLLPSFEGAHRANTGDTLAGEVLLDLCTYDNMNIKSCQKVTES